MKSYRFISVRTHYLEMTTAPSDLKSEEKEDCVIMKLDDPNIIFYRYLYKEVGEDITWVNRLVIEDEELYTIITKPTLQIFVLYYKGSPAGYAEIDREPTGEVELIYFGLTPRYRGLGLGKYFLDWTIKKVWSSPTKRFWLHTCELDHEAALPTYQKAGFNVYNQSMVDQLILD